MGSSASSQKKTTSVKSAPVSRNQGGNNGEFKEVEVTPRPDINSNKPASKNTPTGTAKTADAPGVGQASISKTSTISRAEESDIHALLGQRIVREKTMLQKKVDQPKYKDDDLVMETFYHSDGKHYSCLYRDGQRFYMDDWQSQDWQPFPQEWLSEGVLVTEKVVGKTEQENPEANEGIPAAANQTSDDREGVLEHPTKGQLQTYMFEERRNVHYYFDNESGLWIRIPIAWELKHDLVTTLLAPLQEAVPDWKDKFDMLAALRASNYDPHDTIATYLCHEDHGVKGSMSTARNPEDAKLLDDRNNQIHILDSDAKKLRDKLASTEKALQSEKKEKENLQHELAGLRERVSDLESDYSQATAQVDAFKRERPKTAKKKPEAPKVDPAVAKTLQQNVKALHKDYSQLKMITETKVKEIKEMFKNIAVHLSKIALVSTDSSKELQEIRELYRREALQRKLLYNKLQEMRGNIRVFARCRFDSGVKCCLSFPDSETVVAPGSAKPFKFDKIFTPKSTQDEVFKDTEPIITSCVDGYNVTIMAYGQTGSGKTYTMQGPKDDPGVNTRSLSELLKICKKRDNITYTLTGSMVEIYNENIVDLLTSSATPLDLKAQGNKVVLPGMTEMHINNLDDIENIILLGQKNRTVAATKMNSTSSRSHLLFMVKVEGMDKKSKQVTTGTLTLCDLAGSERVGKTEATGQRLVEAAAINKSLSALGQVFTALRQGQLHVPYRNSKLTHMLQPSLGGDAKACLFVACSPDENNVSETVSSLQFGSNARQVALGQAKKNIRGPPQPGTA